MSGKVLYLPLKKKWFDLIKSGEKKEEYREIKLYYEKRLLDFKSMVKDYRALCFKLLVFGQLTDICKEYSRNFERIVFTLGYPRADDAERRVIFKNPKIRFGEGKPEWGAEKGKKYFVITWEEK